MKYLDAKCSSCDRQTRQRRRLRLRPSQVHKGGTESPSQDCRQSSLWSRAFEECPSLSRRKECEIRRYLKSARIKIVDRHRRGQGFAHELTGSAMSHMKYVDAEHSSCDRQTRQRQTETEAGLQRLRRVPKARPLRSGLMRIRGT